MRRLRNFWRWLLEQNDPAHAMTDRRRLTFRCSICSINWPYIVSFTKCPQCGEECRGLRLDTPTTLGDHIMGVEEATDYCVANGLELQPNHVRRVKSLSAWIPQLRRDLDNWGVEAPDWMKR